MGSRIDTGTGRPARYIVRTQQYRWSGAVLSAETGEGIWWVGTGRCWPFWAEGGDRDPQCTGQRHAAVALRGENPRARWACQEPVGAGRPKPGQAGLQVLGDVFAR